MKTTITLLTLLLIANLGLSQNENGPDTTRFKVGKTEFIIVDKDTMRVDQPDNMEEGDDEEDEFDFEDRMDLAHWSGFGVGVNLLMNNQFQNDFQENHLILDPLFCCD